MGCAYCHGSSSQKVTIWNPSFIGVCSRELSQCTSRADVRDVFLVWRKRDRNRNKYMTLAVPCACSGRYSSFNPDAQCLVGPVRDLVAFAADVSRYESTPEDFEWKGAS